MQENKIHSDVVRSVYDSIKELYLNYCEELEECKKNVEDISFKIKEIQDYISYLDNHQNSDAFVFSPRGVISKNSGANHEAAFDSGKVIDFSDVQKKKDELTSLENDKKSCEEKISKLNSTICILSDNKDILKQILLLQTSFEEEQNSLKEKQNLALKEYEEKKADFLKEINNGPIDKLSFISHSLDVVDSYILQDPMRAKLELKKLKETSCSVTDCLEQLVRVPEGDS